jgi:serine/threonine-protein kinase
MGRKDEAKAPIGEVIAGKYRVRGLLGRGGVGSVFEVERITDGEILALKRLDRATTRDDVAVGRFAREARAAGTARSSHIVQVLDVGNDGGSPFLLMERLKGEDLGARLQRSTRLPPEEAIEIARQILEGLEAAHTSGVVHRDLKPDNIFLCEGQGVNAKILDFGMSKIQPPGTTIPLSLTRSGVAVGTPLYMSPEQASARSDVDAKSDLYSVGAILFECLTGRPPHVGETSDAVIHLIRTRRAPRVRDVSSRVAKDVADVVDKALSFERAERFASATEMRAALAAASLETRGRGRARRTLWLAGASAIAIGAMLAVAAATFLRGANRAATGVEVAPKGASRGR